MIKKVIFIVLAFIALVNIAYRVDLKKGPYELVGELMYFPSGKALRALSLGFYGPLADYVWFRFIQYYGLHRQTDRQFEYMYHICDILTTLDPQYTFGYTLGALMLTHDAKRPDQAKALLTKGMRNNPDDWRYPFMYAFMHYALIGDYAVAQRYFFLSASKPNAPETPRRWAAFFMYKKIGDLETALVLWIDFYNSTDNALERQTAQIYINSITMELHEKLLNEKVTEFKARFHRYPENLEELVEKKIIGSIPVEPHGYDYVIQENIVRSTYERTISSPDNK